MVISLYDDNFNDTFPEGFAEKTLHRDMNIDLLDGTAEPTSYEELAKLAIRYSDGVIVNGDNVSPALIEYAVAWQARNVQSYRRGVCRGLQQLL